jgi:DNA-directed RNA polymerase specialized sigma24 family protein
MTLFQERPELLHRFRDGRKEALAEVYRTYRERVDAYLGMLSMRRRCDAPEPCSIADLRQEIFMRALSPRARAAYDATRPYAPYLMKIARNYFLDQARVRRRETLLVDARLPFWETRDVAWEFCEVEEEHLEGVVQRYVADLPPRLRAVYDQRFVFGESQSSACHALGLTRRKLRTAEEHLKYGLRKVLVRRSLVPHRP